MKRPARGGHVRLIQPPQQRQAAAQPEGVAAVWLLARAALEPLHLSAEAEEEAEWVSLFVLFQCGWRER